MSLPNIVSDPGKVFKCPIRGHDHNLTYKHTLQQMNSVSFAYIYECPTGYYRWMVFPDENELNNEVRKFKRPRWGW